MAQFDLRHNPRSGDYPLLLDLQAELLGSLATRIVAPLISIKKHGARPITRLNPVVKVRGVDYLILFQELAAVPVVALGEVVGSLAARRTELIAALDLIFTGA